jgi:hypothetical protein
MPVSEELAAEFLADLRHLDTQLRECRTMLTAAVRASGTSLTGLFGVGPVIAGIIIGDVADVSRIPGRDDRDRPGHRAAGRAGDAGPLRYPCLRATTWTCPRRWHRTWRPGPGRRFSAGLLRKLLRGVMRR